VRISGVWQAVQPTLSKRFLPRAALVESGAGVGPSRKRMKSVNCIQSASRCTGLLNPSLPVSLRSVRLTSLGCAFFGPLQSGFSSTAWGKSSLVTPISTL
jgi:hypothetical protein